MGGRGETRETRCFLIGLRPVTGGNSCPLIHGWGIVKAQRTTYYNYFAKWK